VDSASTVTGGIGLVLRAYIKLRLDVSRAGRPGRAGNLVTGRVGVQDVELLTR
jgi:hypothetical protein